MNNYYKSFLPFGLLVAVWYLGIASVSALLGISIGISATSRVDVYRSLGRFETASAESVSSADPEIVWLLEGTLYHAGQIVTTAAGWTYQHQSLVREWQPYISGFFEFVVPAIMVVMTAAAILLWLGALKDSRVGRAALAAVGWFR